MLAAALVVFAGCQKSATPVAAAPPPPATNTPWEPSEAQPKLPTVKLYFGVLRTVASRPPQYLVTEQMDAEMCTTPRETETGMMFRKSMGTNDGMIFSLSYLGNGGGQASFWMKNCFVPLSVAYINPEGVIEEIHPLQPQDTNSVVSTATNIRFALETPQGWFDQHYVTIGMVVRTERGSLMETFGQRQP